MRPYQNISGNSGVKAFEITPHAITVIFTDNGVYRYSYAKPGRGAVEEMKKLALAGAGLATYINQNVREDYERKLEG